MAHQTIDMRCPGCTAPVTTADVMCPHCFRPLVISTFNSVYDMPAPEVNKYARAVKKELDANPYDGGWNNSAAMCYLKLRLYDKAIDAFTKAIEDDFDNSETYFYAAISLLRGKKAFLAKRSDIDKMEEYLQAATMIEPRGIYYYFMAYIKYDHFYRKSYKTSPTYQEALAMAHQAGISAYDIEQFYSILGVERPSCL